MSTPTHHEDEQTVKRVAAVASAAAPKERETILTRELGNRPELMAQVRQLLAALGHPGASGSAATVREGVAVTDEVDATRREPPRLIGSRIGPYKVLELIGEGGFGEVYLAQQDEPVRRRVALKIVKAGMDSRQVIARFEQERQALALMDHPNIARIYDAGATPPETGSRPYVVMEYVRGEPLTDFCDDHGIGLRERLALFKSICEAVQHAHQKGVIHRDLKPSNVLVAMSDVGGGKPVAKVIDFGIAKAAGERLTDKTLFTEHRSMIGTPAYMSPEQAEMTAVDIDTRTDVYSLGVILYELLTGSTPLDSQTLRKAALGEIQRMIRDVDPPRPSTRVMSAKTTTKALTGKPQERGVVAKVLKGDLDWLVMKAIEKDRTRRYDTASALARDIERYLADLPIEAGPPTLRYRLGKLVRRNKLAVAAGTLTVVALVAGLSLATVGFMQARRDRDRAETALREEAAARGAAQKAMSAAEAARGEAQAARAKAVEQAARATAMLSFADVMLRTADASAAGGRTISIAQMLEKAAEDVGERFKDDPEAECLMRARLGRGFLSLGDLDSSADQLFRALRVEGKATGLTLLDRFRLRRDYTAVLFSRSSLGFDSAFTSAWQAAEDALVNENPELGRLFVGLRNQIGFRGERYQRVPFDRAFDRALSGARKILGPEDPLWEPARSIFQYTGGLVPVRTKDPEAGLAIRRAVRDLLAEENKFRSELFREAAQTALIQGLSGAGRHGEALSEADANIATLGKTMPPESWVVTRAQVDRAALLVSLKRPREAEEALRAVVALPQPAVPPKGLFYKHAELALLRLLEDQGRESECTALREKVAQAVADYDLSLGTDAALRCLRPDQKSVRDRFAALIAAGDSYATEFPATVAAFVGQEGLGSLREGDPRRVVLCKALGAVIAQWQNRPIEQLGTLNDEAVLSLTEAITSTLRSTFRAGRPQDRARLSLALWWVARQNAALGRLDEAERAINERLEIETGELAFSAHGLRGQIMAKMQRWSEAERSFRLSYEGEVATSGRDSANAARRLSELIDVIDRQNRGEEPGTVALRETLVQSLAMSRTVPTTEQVLTSIGSRRPELRRAIQALIEAWSKPGVRAEPEATALRSQLERLGTADEATRRALARWMNRRIYDWGNADRPRDLMLPLIAFAEGVLRAYGETDPDAHGWALYWLGRIHLELGQLDPALRAAEESIRVWEYNRASSRSLRAQILSAQKKHAEAVLAAREAFDEAQASLGVVASDTNMCARIVSEVLVASGPAADAEREKFVLDRINTLQGQPSDMGPGINDIVWSLVRHPRVAPASATVGVQAMERALASNPNNTVRLNTLGVAQYRAGLFAEAVSTLTRCEEIVASKGNQPQTSSFIFAAMGTHRLGRNAEARAGLADIRAKAASGALLITKEDQQFLDEAAALIEASGPP